MNFFSGQLTGSKGNRTTNTTDSTTMTMTTSSASTLQPTSLVNSTSHMGGFTHGGAAALKVDEAIADMMSAIDMLPDEKKSSFLKAKRVCPNLVEAETTPAMFLEHDNFNYWKAAERLAMHWKERENIFGERAFLPMTQTGNGALTKDDIVTLHTGSHARLAPTPSGQPVVFTDRRRILSSSTRESRARCFWYLVSHMAREENAAKFGILFLALVVTPRPSPLDMAYMQQGLVVLKVMPATFHMHLLNNVSKTGKFSVAQTLIQTVVSYCMPFFRDMGIVTESCQLDLKEKLIGLGCVPEGLPPSVGGTWKYEEYTKWCRRRITEELYFEELHLPSSKTDGSRKMTAERKKERTKSLNVLHSRQKRERRKAEQAKMEEDCNQLQNQYFALKKESARLEGLLEQAQRLVQQYEANGGIPLQVGMSNSFDSMPSNVFSSTTPAPAPFEPQTSMSMQGNQFHGLFGTFAMQRNFNQQSPNQQLGHLQNVQSGSSPVMQQSFNQQAPNQQLGNQRNAQSGSSPVMQQSFNQQAPNQQLGNQRNARSGSTPSPSMSQHGSQLNQRRTNQSPQALMQNMNSPETSQQLVNGLWSSQLPNLSANPMNAQLPPMSQPQQQNTPQSNLNLSVQQAMMQAMTMQNALNPTGSQTIRQQNIPMNGDNSTLSATNRPAVVPNMNGGHSSTLHECHGVDSFSHLDAHIGHSAIDVSAPIPFAEMQVGSFVPEAPAPTPPTETTNWRDSVPQEYAGFDIPEPDPLPETPQGVPTYQANRNNYF